MDLNGDGTPDRLDWNRDGTLDVATSVTLQAGQTFLLDDTSANVGAPATSRLTGRSSSRAADTLQVKFITGNPAKTYCTRGLSAFPRGFWTKDYYAPLDQPTTAANGYTDYYLYNPHSSQPSPSTGSRAPARVTFTIPPTPPCRSGRRAAAPSPSTPASTSTEATSSGESASSDADGQTYEWGFSLLPVHLPLQGALPRVGPGLLSLRRRCAADGQRRRLPHRGPGQHAGLRRLQQRRHGRRRPTTLNRLQTQFIYDPNDGDLSQAHIWATGDFTMAYGENADTAHVEHALAGPRLRRDPRHRLHLPGPRRRQVGEPAGRAHRVRAPVATFTITVNSQKYTVDGVNVTDYLPAELGVRAWARHDDHHPSRTRPRSPARAPTPRGGHATTLAWSSAQLGGNMAENQEITITFTAQTTAVLAVGDTEPESREGRRHADGRARARPRPSRPRTSRT